MDDKTKSCLYDICVRRNDLVLVDVMNNLHRFLWKNSELSVTIGDEIICTGHLYGMLRLILTLRDRFKDCSIVLALDGYDKERRQVNTEYKANRERRDDIYSLIPDLVKMCGLVDGVFFCYHKDFEADDVINSVARTVRNLCKSKDLSKYIWVLSNDKDMYQLVRDDTMVPIKIIRKFGTGSSWMSDAEIVDENKVRESFNGVNPENLVKFRAIVGDSSDNLKGYFRFRKSNASIIAENYDYDLDSKTLNLKPGHTECLEWGKFLDKIREDMSIFDRNYRIMRMKYFDFEMREQDFTDKSVLYDTIDLIKKYEMKSYLQRLMSGSYSRYRNQIIRYLV